MNGRTARIVAVLVSLIVALVILANLAVFWHGALFIALLPVWSWFGNNALDWARR